MKNIIVTGCSRGIGFEIVTEFSKLENFKIFAISRNKNGLNKLNNLQCNENTEIFTISEDLSCFSSYQKLFKFCVENSNGKFDGIIHNAGVLIKKNFLDINISDIQNSFNLNSFAPLLLTQKFIPTFNKNAHVLSISSMGGYQNSLKFPGLSIYSISKSTLNTMTQCLAEEYKETSFKFNSLALGAVQTDMLSKAFPDFNAPVSAKQMAKYIVNFYINGAQYFNGQIIPVSIANP